MNNTFIVRCGEVALKGMNKPYFERMLLERIKRELKRSHFEDIEGVRREGLIFIYASDKYSAENVLKEITRVFGVASASHALEVEPDMGVICEKAVEYMEELISKRGIGTFKVESKRSDKSFPIMSPDISKRVGGAVLKACGPKLRVDVHSPDCVLYIHLRRGACYIFADKVKGFGGLPLGTNGKGLVLLSGGIDSPVAAWLMAKRGMLIEAVHFHSYPYTSERAREKVYDLTRILASYCGRIKVHSINLLKIQQSIGMSCPEEEMTILSRRFMMKLAQRIAERVNCNVLITGESIGQVASQTVDGIAVTDNAVSVPVMRPLIAMDKTDIIEIAQRIGTFETSIQPYEDCCTVFLPKHPVTRPKLERILESESKLDCAALIDEALEGTETEIIDPDRL